MSKEVEFDTYMRNKTPAFSHYKYGNKLNLVAFVSQRISGMMEDGTNSVGDRYPFYLGLLGIDV